MPKIFYAYSNNKDTVLNTFNNICNIINKDNEIIIDVDNNKKLLLLDAIKSSIESSDLFICDITPDHEHFNNSFVNSNVIFELGYAMKNLSEDNIIVLLDESKSKNRPSILEGIKYIPYVYDEKNLDYCDDIMKVINEKINDVKQNGKWIPIDYKLPPVIIYGIPNFLENKTKIKKYVNISQYSFTMKLNPTKTKLFIFICYNRKYNYTLDVFNRTLKTDTNIYDLEYKKDTMEELKYIELMARTCWMK